ncbi:hypothetical protein [Streptomyces sp. MMG1121]|uniref:hypothetical protein n=1 Tax=Streptomyces sp. MMG1121 TaxID=1415544 RepID=UPI000A580E7C|nr:hypothetical protein [Streptomyces sp. MMG1121]
MTVKAFPHARVVNTPDTVDCRVMVDPGRVPGAHGHFVSGDDSRAKAQVTALSGEFGRPAERVLDLGGIRTARAVETYLLLWPTMFRNPGSADFNIEVRRAG